MWLTRKKLLVYIRRCYGCYLLLVKLRPGSMLQICSGVGGVETGQRNAALSVGSARPLLLTKIQDDAVVAGIGRGTAGAFLKMKTLTTSHTAVKPSMKHTVAT